MIPPLLAMLIAGRDHVTDPLDIVWLLVAAVARWASPSSGEDPAPSCLEAPSIARGLARALRAPEAPLEGPLALCADHELNASTFAARVAAGTGADPVHCVVAALATWAGPRHGLASESVEDWLDAPQPPPSLPSGGFGHPLYPLGDPRAEALLSLCDTVPAAYDRAVAPPNLDAGLVAWRRSHGLPRGSAAALFAVARSAGWLAHAAEQRGQRMVRPRARYVGPPLEG